MSNDLQKHVNQDNISLTLISVSQKKHPVNGFTNS